jgi:hypothetical protein
VRFLQAGCAPYMPTRTLGVESLIKQCSGTCVYGVVVKPHESAGFYTLGVAKIDHELTFRQECIYACIFGYVHIGTTAEDSQM